MAKLPLMSTEAELGPKSLFFSPFGVFIIFPSGEAEFIMLLHFNSCSKVVGTKITQRGLFFIVWSNPSCFTHYSTIQFIWRSSETSKPSDKQDFRWREIQTAGFIKPAHIVPIPRIHRKACQLVPHILGPERPREHNQPSAHRFLVNWSLIKWVVVKVGMFLCILLYKCEEIVMEEANHWNTLLFLKHYRLDEDEQAISIFNMLLALKNNSWGIKLIFQNEHTWDCHCSISIRLTFSHKPHNQRTFFFHFIFFYIPLY